jgi:exosortase/archaeosortase family protein
VTHVRAGNVIEIPGRRLFVEEACSGVNSLFSALACTVFYLLWTRRHAFVWFVLLASVPFWVLTANAGRITLVAWLRYHWDIAADVGRRHDALGYAVFAIAMILLFATERLLTFYAAVRPPKRDEPRLTAAARPAETPSSLSPRWWLLPTAAACLLLVLQMPALAREVRDYTQAAAQVRLDVLEEDFLPPSFAAWQRKDFDLVDRNRASAFGEHSQVWKYLGSAQAAVASLDYPFVGWHELTECYEAQGWHVQSRTTGEAADGLSYVAVAMQHPLTGRHGRLWFTMLRHDGRSMAARKLGEVEEMRDRIAARLREQLSWTPPAESDDDWTYQVQTFVEGYAPPTESSVADGLNLFVDFTGRLRKRWSAPAP